MDDIDPTDPVMWKRLNIYANEMLQDFDLSNTTIANQPIHDKEAENDYPSFYRMDEAHTLGFDTNIFVTDDMCQYRLYLHSLFPPMYSTIDWSNDIEKSRDIDTLMYQYAKFGHCDPQMYYSVRTVNS